MSSLAYEDVNEFDPRWPFSTTNEDVTLWQEILKDVDIHDAAAICSGGEIGLFLLLPRISSRLVLVDHSYESLYYALVKYILLKERDSGEVYSLFTDRLKTSELGSAVGAISHLLPAKVSLKYESIMERHLEISRVWMKIPESNVSQAKEKLDQVKFIHGDMSDLQREEPFGFFYISNALEHEDRNRTKPDIAAIQSVVRPGGFILCSSGSFAPKLPQAWELVEQRKDPNTTYGWMLNLYRINS